MIDPLANLICCMEQNGGALLSERGKGMAQKTSNRPLPWKIYQYVCVYSMIVAMLHPITILTISIKPIVIL
ncbi:MAG: hypothetical protein K1566_14755 [Candidatus Thiodiazotropha sp. (ex. Lucinisca nassula)]|nr:hypothetical protein [Candidatus Thiodiazotropha sp. (ex. Lucinisca nassula)]MBW9262322.1 hypothetical protein [Candidatus Thiodiazotropha sp. (ex. Lucinisca nassula)]MBW9270899.1 hypothetical protein [Candidatus Thiodiazotropha sp. (ex. Lucinisca nassula)]